ncbi:MAG: MBL fold metallo-hydrolase [Candidatus Abawacabacteria bacterium]|nr:MBL fold metallo-hydrolase [Candidatus Abawacabacteria bacterium]
MAKLIICFHLFVLGMLYGLYPISNQTRIYFLDVAQGDATLIVTSRGHTILIDAGPQQNILAPLAKYLPPFQSTLDLIIFTHPHADHIDGVLALTKHYRIGAFMLTDVDYKSINYEKVKNIAVTKNILLIRAQADEDLVIDDITINILFPFASLAKLAFANINNASIVLQVEQGESKCLFSGDMEKELEGLLGNYYGKSLQSNCLKVGHHGSKTSSTYPFLQLVNAQEMFISVGRNNRYGHPNRATLYRLCGFGAVYRSDEVGTMGKFLLQ